MLRKRRKRSRKREQNILRGLHRKAKKRERLCEDPAPEVYPGLAALDPQERRSAEREAESEKRPSLPCCRGLQEQNAIRPYDQKGLRAKSLMPNTHQENLVKIFSYWIHYDSLNFFGLCLLSF